MNASNEVLLHSKIYLEYRIWSIPAIFLRDIIIGYYIGTQNIKAARGSHAAPAKSIPRQSNATISAE